MIIAPVLAAKKMSNIIENNKQISCIVTPAKNSVGEAIIQTLQTKGSTVVAMFHGETSSLMEIEHNYYMAKANPTDLASIQHVIKSIQEDVGKIKYFVTIIGDDQKPYTALEPSMDNWNEIMTVNISKALNCSQAILPYFKENSFGKIINIGYYPKRTDSTLSAPYSISKEALISLSKTITKENSQYNIDAYTYFPETIDSPDNRKAMTEADWSKWVQPSEIAIEICKMLFEIKQEKISVKTESPKPAKENKIIPKNIKSISEKIKPAKTPANTPNEKVSWQIETPVNGGNRVLNDTEVDSNHVGQVSFKLFAILKKQKLYKKALDVLEILDKMERDPERVKREKRDILQKMISAL